MTKISMKARKEIIDKHAGKYRKASKKEKTNLILTLFSIDASCFSARGMMTEPALNRKVSTQRVQGIIG